MVSMDALHRSDPDRPGHHAAPAFAQTPAACSRLAPLCVDMDGTLLNTDSLIECFFAVIKDGGCCSHSLGGCSRVRRT